MFFGYGEQQDFKDASKQIAVVDQAGLGMPERTTTADGSQGRDACASSTSHMLRRCWTLAGSTPEQAAKDAEAIMVFETELAKASMPVTERRDPEKIYHLQPIATFETTIPSDAFELVSGCDELFAAVSELNNATPEFMPAMMKAVT